MSKQQIFNVIIVTLCGLLFSPSAKASFELPSLPGKKSVSNGNTQPPPQPVPESIEVGVGETVKIPLRIYGSPAGGARFLIRSKPRHGKLGAVQQVNENSAYVTYTHDGKPADTADGFTYAAQSDNGVSAAATVQLKIKDAAPKFIAPPTLNFGKVFVGETKARSIILQNKGGGTISGEASVDAPWKIDGTGTFSLARKVGSQTLKISVTPDHPGLIRQELRYSNDPQNPTEIVVNALPVFAAPETLALKTNAKTGDREGILEISNATAQPLNITVGASDPLSAPSKITVPAHQKSKLKISSKSPGAINGQISLTTNGYTATVAVSAGAVPAKIEASSAQIELGSTSIGDAKNSSLILTNNGGATAEITAKIAPPFSLTANDAHFSLAAGASRKITVSAAANDPGEFHAVLKIQGAGQKLEIPVGIRIAAASSAAPVSRRDQTANRNASAAASSSEPSVSPTGARNSPLGTPLSILPVRNLRLKTVAKTSCELAWEIPANSEAVHFSVENGTPHVEPKSGMTLTWKKMPNSAIEKTKNTMTAKVTGLQPGRPYVLRVTADNPENSASEFTPEIVIHTLPPWRLKITLLRVLFVALIIVIGLIIYQKRRNR